MPPVTVPTTPRFPEQLRHAGSLTQHHDFSVVSQGIPDVPLQDVDAEKHPKGRRKRTAVKDKVILEEAYRCNPKPDKQARQEIVNRVSLNEKEVQIEEENEEEEEDDDHLGADTEQFKIWFQNRRQNDRRKSRPLSPEELAALRFGGMHHVSPDSPTSRSSVVNVDSIDNNRRFPSPDPAGSRSVGRGAPSPSPSLTRPGLTRSHSEAALMATPRTTHHDACPSLSQGLPPLGSQRSEDNAESMSRSFPNSVGYLANRWNLGSSLSTPSTLDLGRDDTLRLEPFLPPSSSSPLDKRHGTRSKSQSQIGLSLSLEGKAEVVSNQASPSRTLSAPPQHPQRAGLSRSHSALPGITLPPISALTSSLPPPRFGRGRSRNVEAWESCADSERRDELTTQAEDESNGSAIAAISLLRSSSGVLQPVPSKRNVSLSRATQPRSAKKARLSRTQSTFARLETASSCGADSKKSQDKKSDVKVKVSMLVSPTDSDKENWSPDEDGTSQHGHLQRSLLGGGGGGAGKGGGPANKPQNPRRQERGLRDCHGPSLLSTRANTAPMRVAGGSKASAVIDIFVDGSLDKKRSGDDEVERFMRGQVSPSKKPDMDCVAGLLSLSQGAWR